MVNRPLNLAIFIFTHSFKPLCTQDYSIPLTILNLLPQVNPYLIVINPALSGHDQASS